VVDYRLKGQAIQGTLKDSPNGRINH
jgi:hypothetical protein